jgi:hypothetical protein
MATSNKILGQSKPPAATNTPLYTVQSLLQANVNIFIANQAAGPDSIRVAITKSGSVLNIKDYLVYDTSLQANSSMNITGLALAAGDFITIYCTSGNCSFNACGIEIA